jgi:hypothetical protein
MVQRGDGTRFTGETFAETGVTFLESRSSGHKRGGCGPRLKYTEGRSGLMISRGFEHST